MFITEREAKWRSSSSRRAGQLALTQRKSTSPSSRTSRVLQRGQWVGKTISLGAARMLGVFDH